ncbi:MAG TPA: TVP38/TMEM64 family protein [Caulobacteraceae bacterium]|nr:TVP38/TMEM64 family protein [Caulobacteraceae bacterium]
MLRRFIAFITNMDARAWRTVAISFLLFGGVGVVFLFGAPLLGISGEGAAEQMLGAAHGVWALPVAVLAFAALAFIGVPQFVLIAAAVVAFGPWTGIAYSWIGTMVSSAIGFFLGRQFGGRLLRDYGGEGIRKFMTLIGKNGFMASLIVRLVPSAPFIVVNMAAGVTLMRFRDFLAGTGIGIVPKIALTAFAGNSIVQAMRGGGMQHVVMLALAAAVWLVAGWYARIWLKRREAAAEAESAQ